MDRVIRYAGLRRRSYRWIDRRALESPGTRPLGRAKTFAQSSGPPSQSSPPITSPRSLASYVEIRIVERTTSVMGIRRGQTGPSAGGNAGARDMTTRAWRQAVPLARAIAVPKFQTPQVFDQ